MSESHIPVGRILRNNLKLFQQVVTSVHVLEVYCVVLNDNLVAEGKNI
jgi:hypothetical protein